MCNILHTSTRKSSTKDEKGRHAACKGALLHQAQSSSHSAGATWSHTSVPVYMSFWWPPPKSIYLKTLTNSNYVGPLLWFTVFLSSPAIFDSWADPPPLAHSCLPACCSWHHIQKSSSLSAVPSNRRGTSKGFRRALSTWTSLNLPRLPVDEGRGEEGASDPLWLFVCVKATEEAKAFSFSNIKSPKVKAQPLIHFQQPRSCSASSSSSSSLSVPRKVIPPRPLVFPTLSGAVCPTWTVWRHHPSSPFLFSGFPFGFVAKNNICSIFLKTFGV